MIKAVIFDCFGVLVSNSWHQFLDDFAHSDEARYEATQLLDAMDRGEITEREFVDSIGKTMSISEQTIRSSLFDAVVANHRLFDFIDELSKTYPLAILSNISSKARLREVLSDEQIRIFDTLILSGEVGMIKPDERIYHLAAQNLGVTPEECLFVDDRGRYCQAARDVGMQAIQYKNFEQFKNNCLSLLSQR